MTAQLTTDQPCPLCGGHGLAFDHNKILALIDKVAVQRAPGFTQKHLADELRTPITGFRDILMGRAKWTRYQVELLVAMDREPAPVPTKFEVCGKSVYLMTRTELIGALKTVCSMIPLKPV